MRRLLSLFFLLIAISVLAQIPFPFGFWKFGGSPVPDILWWKLNEGSGTTMADSSGSVNNGTNNATWITGVSGSDSALDFDGMNDSGTATNSLSYGTNIITVAFWMYVNATNIVQVIFESGIVVNGGVDRWLIYGNSTGPVQAWLQGTTGNREETYTPIGLSVWNHWLFVFDNSTASGDIRIFKNGSEVSTTLATNTKTGTNNFATQPLFMAARASLSTFYNGRLDDVRIYTGDRSSSVLAIYGDPQ